MTTCSGSSVRFPRPGVGIDARSDWDVAVILRDDAALARVEIASTTFDQLREHTATGSDREWARYQYAHVDVLLDG